MRLRRGRRRRGGILPLALAALTATLALGAALMTLARSSLESATRQADDAIALELAAAGVEKAVQDVQHGTVQTMQLVGLSDRLMRPAVLSVQTEQVTDGWYRVTSTAHLHRGTVTVEAYLNKHPKSRVFDYAYFLNNWAWYWDHDVHVSGDSRGNGRFDLYEQPQVNGHLYAHFEIDDHGDGISGLASNASYRHQYAPRVEMPSLLDLSYYEALGQSENSSLRVGDTIVTSGGATVTDDAILVGTATAAILVDGPVVFQNDVVIKGYVTGYGCIYAGRNLYIAGDIEYLNPPPSPRPPDEGQDPVTRDQFVYQHQDKDLIGFAARGNIIQGDYTGQNGGQWRSDLWLFDMGNEDVGLDGIPDTGDEGEGDGVFQAESEDLDGDGEFRNYSYSWADVQTLNDISTFAKYGTNQDIATFSDIATNLISTVWGVYFTNHAFAGRTGYSACYNGSVICKDEAIIFRDQLTFNYDERVHSRYNDDPNTVIELGLFPASPVPELACWHQPKLEGGGGA